MCRIFAAAFVCAVILSPAGVHACSTPVFRYALEKWEPDRYEALVFHHGPLSEEHSTLIGKLGKRSLDVKTVDLSQRPPEKMVRLWKSLSLEQLPCLALRYLPARAGAAAVWAGPLTETTVRTLADSPARREIARRILDGDCAVWIFLESGHLERDETARKRLEGLLVEMERILELPEPVEGLEVSFSLLSVSRKDPAEQVLVNMLLGSEPDLSGYNDQPIVFPVFGRGHVLYAIIGKGIGADTVREACQFIVGACSCQVKAQNPGFDLLIEADWTGQLTKLIADEDLPPLAGTADLTVMERPAGAVPAGSDAPLGSEGKKGSGPLVRSVLTVLVLAVTAAIVGTVAVRRVRKG